MQINERIKRVREYRKLTQKELGLALGGTEKSAAVRVGQYETGVRIPKKDTAILLGNALQCNPAHFMHNAELGQAESIMMDLFWLEERMAGSMYIFQLEKYSDRDDERVVHGAVNDYNYESFAAPVGLAFNYLLINGFMAEWAIRYKELKEKKITPEEYFEWKLNWPQTCDDCGRFKPSYEWRKESNKEELSM